jgi:hypothetical protein
MKLSEIPMGSIVFPEIVAYSYVERPRNRVRGNPRSLYDGASRTGKLARIAHRFVEGHSFAQRVRGGVLGIGVSFWVPLGRNSLEYSIYGH